MVHGEKYSGINVPSINIFIYTPPRPTKHDGLNIFIIYRFVLSSLTYIRKHKIFFPPPPRLTTTYYTFVMQIFKPAKFHLEEK